MSRALGIAVSLTLLTTVADRASAAPKVRYEVHFIDFTGDYVEEVLCHATEITQQPFDKRSHYKAALLVNATWSVDTPVATDPSGLPLVISDTTVEFARDPCKPGSCEVDLLDPAPPGQKWVSFLSTSDVLSPVEDGTLEFRLHYSIAIPAGQDPAGQVVGSWFSDNNDDLYGWNVTDGFVKSVISGAQVPTVSQWGIGIMALLLLVGAKIYFDRRRVMQA